MPRKITQKDTKRSTVRIAAAVFILALIIVTASACDGYSDETVDGYIENMKAFKGYGDSYVEMEKPLQAEFSYGYAAAGLSALRFAVENILALKGEKIDLMAETETEFRSWDKIAALSYASPYPYYFEGIVLYIQGDTEKTEECLKNALVNQYFTGEEDFTYINDLSVKELKSLRTKLLREEKALYSSYAPDITENLAAGRQPYNFDDVYLRKLGAEALKKDPADLDAAKKYFKLALKANPFEAKNFTCLALLALETGNVEDLEYYVTEGLWYAEDDDVLGALATSLLNVTGGEEQ